VPPEFTQGERIADQALQAVLGRYYQSAQSQGRWFPEAAWETPSLKRHMRTGVLCDVVWRTQLECHRRMGTQ
jgi:hypothetical protein